MRSGFDRSAPSSFTTEDMVGRFPDSHRHRTCAPTRQLTVWVCRNRGILRALRKVYWRCVAWEGTKAVSSALSKANRCLYNDFSEGVQQWWAGAVCDSVYVPIDLRKPLLFRILTLVTYCTYRTSLHLPRSTLPLPPVIGKRRTDLCHLTPAFMGLILIHFMRYIPGACNVLLVVVTAARGSAWKG